jgi:hypothetical protein
MTGKIPLRLTQGDFFFEEEVQQHKLLKIFLFWRDHKMKQQGKKDTVEKGVEKKGKFAEKTLAVERPLGAKKLFTKNQCCKSQSD